MQLYAQSESRSERGGFLFFCIKFAAEKKPCQMIKNLLIIVVVAFYLSLPKAGFSQAIPSGGMDGDVNRIEGKFKFIPLPYVNYNRSIGFTVGAIPMAMFNPVKDDTLSPSSIAAVLGMYSTNKTWFVMGFGALFLDADNWRIVGAGGVGSVNFQFYLDDPISQWIPYNTQADFIFAQVQRRIYDKIYSSKSTFYFLETLDSLLCSQ